MSLDPTVCEFWQQAKHKQQNLPGYIDCFCLTGI